MVNFRKDMETRRAGKKVVVVGPSLCVICGSSRWGSYSILGLTFSVSQGENKEYLRQGGCWKLVVGIVLVWLFGYCNS